jgi:glutamate 5-kinase
MPSRDSQDTEVIRLRRTFADARRVVVKVGSSSLTSSSGGAIDMLAVSRLVDLLARRRLDGHHIVLVSSGAIAAGLGPLGLKRRPRDLATQQAAASVGQGALVAAYQHLFGIYGLTVGQVLLTADDVTRRTHYTNAQRTLEKLLELGIVPIVNENVLLSDVDALYDGPPSQAGSRPIPFVRGPEDLAEVQIGGTGSGVGSGGMATKVEAAGIAGAAGIPTVLTRLADARAALVGDPIGTLFAPVGDTRASRKRWIAHATSPRGRLVLDAGAVEAVTARRKSLLPAGITAVQGRFTERDPVDVCAPDGTVVARGLVNYSSSELPRLLGRSTKELARELGAHYEREVIHRDDLAVL